VKYADDLGLMAKVLQGVTDKLIEVGMEINVEN
jgi:hypothetical protein